MAVPIVAVSSWQSFILILSLFVFLAFLLWLPNLGLKMAPEKSEPQATDAPSLWKNKGALIFLMFGGLQSLLFYSEITWLPTITQSVGLSKADAGILVGVYSLIGLPVSMVIPEVLSRLNALQRAHLMAALSGLTLLGLGLMMTAQAHFGLWLLIHILLGISTGALFPHMMLSFSVKTSSSQATAQLSGMVQTGGYIIAALGPVLLGYSYPLFSSWLPLICALLVVTLVMIWSIYKIEKEDIIL